MCKTFCKLSYLIHFSAISLTESVWGLEVVSFLDTYSMSAFSLEQLAKVEHTNGSNDIPK